MTTIPRGAPVIVGFPHDEGVRRNGGRVGSAAAPQEIRRWLYRMVAWNPARDLDLASLGLIDLGDLPVSADLEADQAALGEILRHLLTIEAVPIVLGGGHETAFGVYQGHALVGDKVRIINLDAHLDVRPTLDGLGHSGSPFRQAIEYASGALPGSHYTCLGAQPFSVSREHLDFVRQRGGTVVWSDELAGRLLEGFQAACNMQPGRKIHLSIDADVVNAAEVPGVSAPNPSGLSGIEVARCAALAGSLRSVSSLELVEINPRFDLDGRSARWGALVIWEFLCGLAARRAAKTV